MLLLLTTLALAESADVLGPGQQVVYAGLGAGTFQYGSSGQLRDRQWRARVDSYGALALGQRFQLAADIPLVRTGILVDHEDRSPCPRDSDYCDPVLTLGEAGLHGRLRVLSGDTKLAVDLGARSDQWNASTRHRWTNAGQGATSFVGSLLFGQLVGPTEITAWARYGLVIGRPVETASGEIEWLPPDWAGGGVQGAFPLGPLRGQLAVIGFSRLGGLPFGSEWANTYPSSDYWAALRYRELRGEAKLSIPLGEEAGLHLTLGRIIVADSGPKDAWDASVGVHRWWSGSGG